MKQDNLNLLQNIKRIEVSDLLYDKIVLKIEQNRINTVPFYKVGIAASLLFAMIISQLFMISKSEKMNTPSIGKMINLVEINNNSLYHE